MDQYIKLISQAYSGSTLLSFLLGNHPEVATVGELAGKTYYEGYLCSCKNLLTDCPFWFEVSDRLKSKGISIDLKNFGVSLDSIEYSNFIDAVYNKYFPCKLFDRTRDLLFAFDAKRQERTLKTIKLNLLLAETITTIYGKKHFFDSTKDLSRIRHLLNSLNSKIKFIYLTRDGRAVCNSALKHRKVDAPIAIKRWLWVHRMNTRILKHYIPSNQIFYLKYEDLCINLESKLKEIFEFIGVDPFLKIEKITSDGLHIIGNVMRETFSGHVCLDQKWKTELKAPQLALFEKLAGTQNRQLGYV